MGECKKDVNSSVLAMELCQSQDHIDGLEQYCSVSSVLAMEILQSFTKPSIWW